MIEEDIARIRAAIGAYFRAASALGSASLLLRHAASTFAADREFFGEPDTDEAFLLDRAATYHQKAQLMSESAAALLLHSEAALTELVDIREPLDWILGDLAAEAGQAAEAYAEVVDALANASFGGAGTYPALLDELRASSRFLHSETAIFAQLAEDESDEGDELEDGDQLYDKSAPDPAEDAEPDGAGSAMPRRSGAPRFDRRVPAQLLQELSDGGSLAWVSHLARQALSSKMPLDLGLRANPKKPGAGHATLYAGTTQALGVHLHPDGRFRLSSHVAKGLFGSVQPPFNERWAAWQPLDRLIESMSSVRAHVEAALLAVPASRLGEGFYQAALTKSTEAGFALLDREIVFAFTNTQERVRCKIELQSPIRVALDRLAKQKWAEGIEPLGDKIDALAIDDNGALLVIEVKPGKTTKGVTWTPIQVAMYARLVGAWVESDPDFARQVLEGMVSQRTTLGLGSKTALSVSDPIEIVPVIAIGGPVTGKETRDRFRTVQDALGHAGEPLTGLRIWRIDGNGEIDTNSTELD